MFTDVKVSQANHGIQKPPARFYFEVERSAWDAILEKQSPSKLQKGFGKKLPPKLQKGFEKKLPPKLQKGLEKQLPPKLKKGWADLLRNGIQSKNSLCPFSFDGYGFLKGRFDYFFRAYGHCKHGNTLKTMSKNPCWNIEVFALKGNNERRVRFRVV